MNKSRICNNCGIDTIKGRGLVNGKFLCNACIEKIERLTPFVKHTSSFKRNDFSNLYQILWIIIIFSLAPAIILPALFFIPVGAFSILIIAWLMSKTSNSIYSKRRIKNIKEDIEHFDEYLDNWYKYPPDWDKRREKVFKRDKNQCIEGGSRRALHVHHIVPISKGGNHTLSNLKTLCVKCHSNQKGHSNLYEMYKRREKWSGIRYIRNFTEHKARKSYTCYICNITINPGVFYYRGGFYDRSSHRGETYHICFSCWKKRHV